MEEKESQSEKEKEKIPTPPKMKASLRTLETDVSSLRETGGQAVRPTIVKFGKEEAEVEEGKEEEEELKISGYTGPEKAIFETGGPRKISKVTKPAKPKPKKVKFIVVIIIIAITLLAISGFYLMLFKKPQISEKEPASLPVEVEPTEKPKFPTSVEKKKPEVPSIFELSESAVVYELTISEINKLVEQKGANMKSGQLKEIVLTDITGEPISSSEFIPIVIPGLKEKQLLKAFRSGFNFFIFYQENQPHFGVIFKLKPGVVIIRVKSSVSPYLEEQKLNYIWYKDYLLVSENQTALEKVKQLIK